MIIRILLLSISLSFYSIVIGQETMSYITGQPVRELKFENYSGSPFLFKEFQQAYIKGIQGTVLLNVDLYNNKVYFKRNDTLFTYADRLNSFYILKGKDSIHFTRAFTLHPTLTDEFVEVLAFSPLIIKRQKKNLSEEATYGSSKSFRYTDIAEYSSIINTKPSKLNLSKEDAKKLFGEKWQALESFIADNNIFLKSETGWRTILKYYQQLQSSPTQ